MTGCSSLSSQEGIRNTKTSVSEWNQHYESYTAMIRLQRKLIQAPTLYVVLFQAFRRFPRLRELFIGDLEYLSTSDDSESQSLWHCNSTIKNASIPRGFEYIRPRARHFVSVLNAAGTAGVAPKKIWLTNLDQALFRMPILTYNSPLCACLASVEELRMHVSLIRNPNDESIQDLQLFLEQCRSLRHLEITVSGELFMPSQVLQDQNWPSLQTIEIGHMLLAENDLIGFIHLHKTTVSVVKLHACTLITGKWPSVIIRLKHLFLGYDVVIENDKVFRLECGLLSFCLLRLHE